MLLSLLLLTPTLTLDGGDETDARSYRAAPGPLSGAPLVGQWVPDLALTLVDGSTSSLSALSGEHGLVLAFRDPECPLSLKYGPRTGRLDAELAALGLELVVVSLADADTARADARALGYSMPVAVDGELELAAALRTASTTETVLLDAARTVRYRGMLDDQYGVGFAREAPRRDWLLEAARAVAGGTVVAAPATEAQGCLLPIEDVAAPEREVTYHNRVSRILQQNCERCHRAGGAAPFALDSYETVKKKRRTIAWSVEDGLMPPWFADEESGPWRNDASLDEADRADLLAWLAGGTPEGDPADAPLPRTWVEGWTIGEPDLVIELPEPFAVPAEGVVDYQHFYAPTGLTEDRWVKALELRPGEPGVVHHILAFVEHPDVLERVRNGDRSARAELQDGAETYFACMVPGQDGLVFPEGVGKLLPAGSWIKFQLHYTPNGTATLDRSMLGLVFHDEPVTAEVRTTSALNRGFAIPPGAYEHEVSGTYRFPEDATLLSVFPHTHLRGVRFRFDLAYPDGREELFLELPFYDFNWQLNYELARPLAVPRGTRLRATAWYDNSETNPANPDPSATVRFGEQTFEEMMIGFVNWIPSAELR